MNYIRLFTPALLLRLGLAFVLLYAGLGALLHPQEWIGFLPPLLTDHINPDIALKMHAFGNLFLALWLLSGMWLRYAALAVAAVLGSIIVVNLQALLVTFRDVGLFFAALALTATTFEQPNKK